MRIASSPVAIPLSAHRSIQLKNGFGMVMRRLPFGSLADLELVGNKLYVKTRSGERTKAASLGFHLNGVDKDQLRRAIETATSE